MLYMKPPEEENRVKNGIARQIGLLKKEVQHLEIHVKTLKRRNWKFFLLGCSLSVVANIIIFIYERGV